jgi:hypothetical protein
LKKRDLSDFMTQELLYDYVNGLLDDERKKSVEEVLIKSEEVKAELHTIKKGLQYLESISETKVSTVVIEQVLQRITYFGQIQKMMSYENWPPFVKWTLEAVLVISIVITISLVAPWGQLKDFVMQSNNSELILAELPKSEINPQVESLKTVEKEENGRFEDESGNSNDSAKITTATDQKTEFPIKKPTAKAVVISKVEEPKKQGFVYRGTLSIVNVEVGTNKLKEMIVELGGRKAGEVELGWRRNEGDFYFHFTIPESKLDKLEEYFKTLGTIKLSKDPHPRVMPNGILRMIITTEESK